MPDRVAISRDQLAGICRWRRKWATGPECISMPMGAVGPKPCPRPDCPVWAALCEGREVPE